MNIQEFCNRFGNNARSIDEAVREWQFGELDVMLGALQGAHDEIVGSAVIVGDALHGDGLLDQIPRELRDAFVKLMHQKADTYNEMRQILLERIRGDDGAFLSFDNPHVRGFINKVKGQIGENIFQRHVGTAAELAHSGSQEGWDVAIRHADGMHEYVQVKLYSDPHKVIEHMRIVHEKISHEVLLGCHGEIVSNVDFAVPADIAEKVCDLKESFPELSSMQVLTIPVSAGEAAGFVEDGLCNVGPEQLRHFFGELFAGAVIAGSLHAIVNGFLWYKGAKEFSDAFANAAASTTISAAGMAVGLIAETFWHASLFSSGFGIGSRIFLARVARSRWGFAEFLEASIAATDAQIAMLGKLRRPEAAI